MSYPTPPPSDSDSLAESESGPKDMTAVNAGVHELAGVRLPLQPYAGGHAVFMYSTAADGNVTLQLRDSDDLDRSGLAAMLARLQDDATLSISYQDADILSDGSIDVLLGTATATATNTATLQGSGTTEAVTATFDLFDSSSGHDLTLSPQTFTNSAEAFINDNSNSLGVPADTDNVLVNDEQKKNGNGATEVVKLTVKRARPKATSPNRQGPQQCQVCAKVFGNASALAKHKLTHSDERKYVCTMCGKAFKRQDHLNGHMLTHRNKKPYECKAEGCGKSYCDARSLRRHTENHHSSTGAVAATSASTASSATSTSSSSTVSAGTSMSPAQGAAAGDAASPHGSSCIQYAPPPTTATATGTTTTVSGKSQLQQLLATEPVKSGTGSNNDGLTKQQLDLIHQIMEQTQRQSQPVTKSPAKTSSKPTTKQPTKIQRVWTSTTPQTASTKPTTNGTSNNAVKSAATSTGVNVVSATAGTSTAPATHASSSTANAVAKPELKPVECNLCHRKFKNIPALNGHMRLHGGYFKKDSENKKCEKKETSGPPLQTASVSVRALIEEKIISKRTTNPTQPQQQQPQQQQQQQQQQPQPQQQTTSSGTNTNNSNTAATVTTPATVAVTGVNTAASTENVVTSRSSAPPLYPLTMHSTGDADSKVTSFVMPAPPAPQSTGQAAPVADKARRHSNAETFTVPRAPSTSTNVATQVQQEAEALADMILKRGAKVSVKRATSDPGRPTQQIQLQFQPGDAFALAGVTYQAEDGGYFSPSLQDDVFHQVQDTMLLQGVDAQQLASIQFQAASLLQEQDEQLQDIASLEDYATVTASLQESVVDSATYQPRHTVNQELQAVLDSPLPESLAEFSTFHASNLDMPSPSYQTQSPAQQFTNSPHPSLAAQSPLQSPLIRYDSPGFAYPTPPASHEGQSPSFVQTSLLPMISPQQNSDFVQSVNQTRDPEEPPQASSPLSAAFFTSTMSSAAAVEEALEEVLPGESISPDDIYPSLSNSPPPQSPISVAMTPVPSPLSSIPTSTTSVSSPRPPTSFTPVSTNITFPMSPHYTLQSQMMPNSDDPLLSSSPKDFSARKRFEFSSLQSLKIVGNGYIDFTNPNLAGILVDNNGELKFIQTSGNPIQAKNLIVTGTNITATNTTIKTEPEIRNVPQQKLQKFSKTTQCTIPINRNAQIQKPKLHVAVDSIKQEEPDDVFLSPTTIPASPNRISRKRPRSEPLQLPVVHQSRLRAARGRPPGAAPYTPLPMLNPSRHGPGLYWNAKLKTTVASNPQNNQDDNSISSSSESVPESDSTPHINVGSHYQCSIPPCKFGREKDDREPTYEHLLWDPGINTVCTDNEVDMYLDFACCAAVPGGGRNKEYALHLLHMCGGNIHEAMLKLMQPMPKLPPDHPLLHYHYSESDQWTIAETEAFHQAINKYDKDFFNIAREIGTKTVKQCIQFYYVWKKVCVDEYRRLRVSREQKGYGSGKTNTEIEFEEKPCLDTKLLGIADTESPMSVTDHRHFICEYSECSASFNSRAALNGHIRIHGGTARRSPTPTSLVERRGSTATPTPTTVDFVEEYPCKICGKVFSKIKSRSAHMKSHRPPDLDQKKKSNEFLPGLVPDTTISSPVAHSHAP